MFRGILLFTLLTAIQYIFGAYVLAYLWETYLVSLGVFKIDMIHAFGIMVIAGFLQSHDYKYEEVDDEKLIKSFFWGLFLYLTYLTTGYVGTFFM